MTSKASKKSKAVNNFMHYTHMKEDPRYKHDFYWFKNKCKQFLHHQKYGKEYIWALKEEDLYDVCCSCLNLRIGSHLELYKKMKIMFPYYQKKYDSGKNWR